MPRNITVTFSDGTSHVYQNAPDDVTPDAVQARAEKEFSKSVTGLDGGAKSAESAKPEQSMFDSIKQGAGNLAAGAVRGAGSIGATLLTPIDAAARAVGVDPNSTVGSIVGRTDRRQAMDAGLQTMGAQPDSLLYKTGKLGGEIAGTAGVGGVLANGARAVGAAPAFVNALATGGMRAGATPGAINMLTRMAGGAVTGGASAGLVDPSQAGTGAVIGGALPPVLYGAGKVAGYGGRVINSLVQPFTENGQQKIAANIINKFAEGGPTAINAAQIVPGSTPTLAEATGNAGIARLQSAARDINPNAFVGREEANAAARTAALDNVAGDAGKLDYFKAARSQAAGDLYGAALDQANAVAPTPYVKGQVTQLLKRPSINEASKAAQKLALERGDKPAMEGSLQALHDVKTALDDKISVAVRDGKGGEAAALGATKDKLLDVMEKLSPAYKEARATYAEMSKPINQMEVLQGLRLTDAKGNITLSKVQSALDGLEKNMNASGIHPAKSLEDTQINTLKAIRDDLLRQTNLSAGKSAGSNTFQNIATDQILGTMLPGKIGSVVNGKIGTLAGQAGNLLYSGANKKITNKLVDMMLDPSAAQAAMNPQAAQLGGFRTGLNALANYAEPVVYRSAPVLSSSR